MACIPGRSQWTEADKENFRWILDNIEAAPRISDPHHVTTRGAGGDDVETNVMPLCRRHHDEVEAPFKGYSYMIPRYPALRDWLILAKRFDVFERAGIPVPTGEDAETLTSIRNENDQAEKP